MFNFHSEQNEKPGNIEVTEASISFMKLLFINKFWNNISSPKLHDNFMAEYILALIF